MSLCALVLVNVSHTIQSLENAKKKYLSLIKYSLWFHLGCNLAYRLIKDVEDVILFTEIFELCGTISCNIGILPKQIECHYVRVVDILMRGYCMCALHLWILYIVCMSVCSFLSYGFSWYVCSSVFFSLICLLFIHVPVYVYVCWC